MEKLIQLDKQNFRTKKIETSASKAPNGTLFQSELLALISSEQRLHKTGQVVENSLPRKTLNVLMKMEDATKDNYNISIERERVIVLTFDSNAPFCHHHLSQHEYNLSHGWSGLQSNSFSRPLIISESFAPLPISVSLSEIWKIVLYFV